MRTNDRRSRAASYIVAVAAMATLAGCGPSSTGGGQQVPPARMERIGPNLSVVLTPLGASRLGLETAVTTAAGKRTIVPAQALLYEPDGQTAVYVKTGALSFTVQFITVAVINGNQVVVSHGLAPGTVVVTVGSEELLGVQNGVGVET
jgi:hypothetical protein